MSPSYGLNAALAEGTVEPPVPLARSWAETYPCESSPLRSKDDVLSSSSPSSNRTTLPLLNLAQGVPGHPPHPLLLEAMSRESKVNVMATHGYGPVFGHPLLRQELAKDMNQRYRGSIKDTEVAITSGCNLAAGVVFHALASPGESIVLPTPWYFNHEMTLTSLSIKVLPLETSSPSFLPSPNSLIKLLEDSSLPSINSRIKALVLVSPNNPTGSIYSRDLIWEFAQVCSRWKIALIIDETYRDFLLDEEAASGGPYPLGKPHDLFDQEAHPDFHWQNTVISLTSFSKSYAIPGHRLGAIIAHSSLFISKEQDQFGNEKSRFGSLAKSLDNLQICPPRTDSQIAVAASITDKEQQSWRLDIANDLLQRRIQFFANLEEKISFNDMAETLKIEQDRLSHLLGDKEDRSPSKVGWKGLCSGGYYAYVRHPFQDTPSELVARGLAALVGIVVLPGSFFRPVKDASQDRDLRISIANVERSKLDTLGARFLLFHALWKTKGIGWGIKES